MAGWLFFRIRNDINAAGASRERNSCADHMSQRDSELRVRPGRIRDSGRRAIKPKSFVGQVMRAARKAGHTGTGFGRKDGKSSRFG